MAQKTRVEPLGRWHQSAPVLITHSGLPVQLSRLSTWDLIATASLGMGKQEMCQHPQEEELEKTLELKPGKERPQY